MDLIQLILEDRSKPKIVQIAKMIGDDPVQFGQLWEIILTEASPIPERACWILDYCIQFHPHLLEPYFREAIDLLKDNSLHNAIPRGIAKALSNTNIPEEYQGELFSICMDHLLSPTSAIAVKAHCMEIARQIAVPYEELQEELRVVINEILPLASAGIRSRAKRILKSLK